MSVEDYFRMKGWIDFQAPAILIVIIIAILLFIGFCTLCQHWIDKRNQWKDSDENEEN